ncbi:MAG: outer membrane lipoprotein carrier protein LolA [Acidobacteria bacterium]|nr:outer membrane lipoprotein carrier protein LolA [Acidobacteriota bacterium]
MKRSAPWLILAPALLAQAPQASLREVVERFDAAQARVESAQAPFTLTLRRAMLRTPTVTKGTLYLKGSEFVHFAFSPPEDLLLHITPKALVSYSPAAKEGELLKIGFIRNADRKFLGLGQKLSYLSGYFDILLGESREVPGSVFLVLQPKTLGLRKRMQSLQIWVDQGSYLPRQVRWTERSGDIWNLELGPLTLNQALPAGVTGFHLPEGIVPRPDFSFFATKKK